MSNWKVTYFKFKSSIINEYDCLSKVLGKAEDIYVVNYTYKF